MSKSFCFISKKQNYDARHIEVLCMAKSNINDLGSASCV